jgi:hypothetical protein
MRFLGHKCGQQYVPEPVDAEAVEVFIREIELEPALEVTKPIFDILFIQVSYRRCDLIQTVSCDHIHRLSAGAFGRFRVRLCGFERVLQKSALDAMLLGHRNV